MNNYIILDGKKYKTPAKRWSPVYGKPATVKTTLMGVVDVTYGPGFYNEWQGEIEGPVVPIDDGTRQVETATAAGTVSTAGNASITVTAAGMTGSPKVYSVAVALSDTASVWAGKVRTALGADNALTALFTVGGSGTSIVLTAKSILAGNDATLNIAIATGTAVGITAAPTSATTTTGVATSWGAILDLRATIAELAAVAFQDHYGAAVNVHALGPFQERSLSPAWDGPNNKIFIQVRLVKA
jgi:hypothetical protein